MRATGFLAPEIIDSGVSGQYTLGLAARDFTKYLAYALAFRCVYTYVTCSDKGDIINWGIKKSYLDRVTQKFSLCGVRIFTSDQKGKVFFWKSDFAHFSRADERDTDGKQAVSLFYQFTTFAHNLSDPALGANEQAFIRRMYEEWEDFAQYPTPETWESGVDEKIKRKTFDLLYDATFEENIGRIAELASFRPFRGLVRVDCKSDDGGFFEEFPKNGLVHQVQLVDSDQFLPVGRQIYKRLDSPDYTEEAKPSGRKPFVRYFYDYSGLFNAGKIDEPRLHRFPLNHKTLPLKIREGDKEIEITTCDPKFYRELSEAYKALTEYFDGSSTKPLNCLLLGPPGSGKTTIARALAGAVNGAEFVAEINLSHFSKPDDVRGLFEEIQRSTHSGKRIYFFDEFDVTIAGSSMIRFLIDYIFEGKVKGEYNDHAGFGRVAFIFSGGTLENRSLLSLIQENASDFDFSRLLFDSYLQTESPLADEFSSLLLMLSRFEDVENKHDNRTAALKYLLGLDKLPDFLSRINGFIVEMPDISDPLAVTVDETIVDYPDRVGECRNMVERCRPSFSAVPSRRYRATEVIEFVTSLEWCFEEIFDVPKQPGKRFPFLITKAQKSTAKDSIVEYSVAYKNMLLCERFSRIEIEMGKKFGGTVLGEWCKDPVNSLLMEKEQLNYLCCVPLKYGARSLASVIAFLTVVNSEGESVPLNESKLGGTKGQLWLRLPKSALESDILQMHLMGAENRDVRGLWNKVFGTRNPRSEIRVDLKGKRVELIAK
jgi:hypothetical protein